jgi:hypothetical protein
LAVTNKTCPVFPRDKISENLVADLPGSEQDSMTHTITVQPSGHRFEAEAQETVLDAGLRVSRRRLRFLRGTGTGG